MKICITGVSSGIWNYITEALKNIYDITWISRGENNFEDIHYYRWDITDEFFLQEFISSSNNYDYIIINAGIWFFDTFVNISPEDHTKIIQTNLLSPILMIHGLLEKKKINKWIIFIGSVVWKKSMKFWASYGASKFGLRWFAMQLKNELKWIKIHIINPGIVNTNFHKNSKIEIHGKYKQTPLESILKTIKQIISWEEKRFEIDL